MGILESGILPNVCWDWGRWTI